VTVRLVFVTGVILVLSTAGITHAQEQPPTTTPPTTPTTAPPVSIPDAPGDVEIDGGGGDGGDVPPATLPLVPVPVGCTAPPMPHIVFVGTVADRDFRSIRFNIDRIRAGRPDPFAANNQIDVRYGLDVQYLNDDEVYLIAAVVDPDLGLLVSRVTPPIEHFGGDEVIGISETDVNCPFFEDPMRTLHLDGTPIEASVTKPFLDAKVRISTAILIPLGLSIGVIFLLAMFRLSIAGLYHSLINSRSPRGVR
jgi:hypothetical protein